MSVAWIIFIVVLIIVNFAVIGALIEDVDRLKKHAALVGKTLDSQVEMNNCLSELSKLQQESVKTVAKDCDDHFKKIFDWQMSQYDFSVSIQQALIAAFGPQPLPKGKKDARVISIVRPPDHK